jgi:hypothetical protein
MMADMSMRYGTRLALATSLAAILMVAPLLASKIKSTGNADPNFDFKGIHSWAWAADGPGDVKMARSSQDDPKALLAIFGPTVVESVVKELGARGLSQVDPADAPLKMHYYVLVTVGFEAQTMGQFLPPIADWGIPPFTPMTQSLNIIQTGSIVLDAVSSKLNRVVWRGVSQTEIEKLKNDDERKQVIRDAVKDLVSKKFPKT